MEKIHRFDHARTIPKRIVHAGGTGAHGRFRFLDNSASKYTFTPVLTDPSRITPILMRFSTVQGPRGSADTVRDVRGLALGKPCIRVNFETPLPTSSSSHATSEPK